MRQITMRGVFAAGLVGLASLAMTVPASPQEKPGDQVVLVVAADGSGDHTTVAEAVAAAPDGATVRIGPGVYEESLEVGRSVVLEGAGTEETTIVAPKPVRGPSAPTLAVADAGRVEVRGLRLMHRGDPVKAAQGRDPVVRIERSTIRMHDVVVAGGPGIGVLAGEGARLTLESSLVARTGVGVLVDEGEGARAEVSIRGCDVRDCVHRGIQIGRGDVVVERCRLSGSSWHGIRYDHASPAIRDNVIFDNERSGIYASGWTRGRITGNLFLRNGMNGVSCWSGAKDVVEGNTFVGPMRECAASLGEAHPDFRRNVFAHAPVGIVLGGVASRGGGPPAVGQARIEDNVAWKVETRLQGESEATGWREVDPGFVAPKKGDYSLAADSPLRAEGVGAADPPSTESPWPEGAAAPPPE